MAAPSEPFGVPLLIELLPGKPVKGEHGVKNRANDIHNYEWIGLGFVPDAPHTHNGVDSFQIDLSNLAGQIDGRTQILTGSVPVGALALAQVAVSASFGYFNYFNNNRTVFNVNLGNQVMHRPLVSLNAPGAGGWIVADHLDTGASFPFSTHVAIGVTSGSITVTNSVIGFFHSASPPHEVAGLPWGTFVHVKRRKSDGKVFAVWSSEDPVWCPGDFGPLAKYSKNDLACIAHQYTPWGDLGDPDAVVNPAQEYEDILVDTRSMASEVVEFNPFAYKLELNQAAMVENKELGVDEVEVIACCAKLSEQAQAFDVAAVAARGRVDTWGIEYQEAVSWLEEGIGRAALSESQAGKVRLAYESIALRQKKTLEIASGRMAKDKVVLKKAMLAGWKNHLEIYAELPEIKEATHNISADTSDPDHAYLDKVRGVLTAKDGTPAKLQVFRRP